MIHKHNEVVSCLSLITHLCQKKGKSQNLIKEGNQLEIIDNNRQQGRAFLTIDHFKMVYKNCFQTKEYSPFCHDITLLGNLMTRPRQSILKVVAVGHDTSTPQPVFAG